jgi:pulcherriminic acid synthase
MSLPLLLSAEVAADPYAFYRRLRDERPLHYDGSVDAFLVTRHADVSAAYRNQVFSTRNYEWQLEPVFGRTLLQFEGQEHSRKRALVSPYFRGQGLARWMPVIERNAAAILDGVVERNAGELVRGLVPGAEVDLLADFAHYLPVYVIADMLGLPKSDHAQFFAWYTAMIDFLSNLAKDPDVNARGLAATRELREYLTPVVAQRRKEPGEDLISALVTAEFEGERLDDEEVKSHVTQLLNAGSETTDKTIGNLFSHLLTRRELFEAVRDDRTLVTAAISETLRFTPPSQMNGRVTTADVEIQGRPVPAGSFVMLIMASANRDERRFADAERYDLYRTDLAHDKAFTATGEHFAFGHGRHFCLGAMLARSELEISTNLLLDRFPGMRLASGFVPRERGLKMRAPGELRVVL